MIQTTFISAFIFSMLFSGTVQADGQQIAQDNQCFKCHAIDSKKKAPSFKSIAHSSDANEIKDVVRTGITSIFGFEKMPAYPHMSATDLNTLTTWILTQ